VFNTCCRPVQKKLVILQLKQRSFALLASVCVCLSTSVAAANLLTFSASGINPETTDTVSGTAVFCVSGTELTVKLTNTSDPLTTNGNLLMGVLFTPSITDLDLTGIDVLADATIWTSSTTSVAGPADWFSPSNAWTDVFGASPPPAGTVGASGTGFAGTFSAGTINLGGGGPDYGIVSSGTFDAPPPSSPNQFDLVEDSLTLTFTSAMDLTNLSVTNVKLLYGTDGTGIIVPEPTTASLMLVLGMMGVAGLRTVS
jgi:hypothetical protein